MALDELTREFLIESQEGLDRMERCLTELEERPKDASLIGDIFRSVHTIKGTTGFLGFKRLEKLAHAGENLLGLLREGKVNADRPTITGLLKLMDGLRSILKTIEAEGSEGEGEDAELIALMEELQAPAKAQAKQPVRLRAGSHLAHAAPQRAQSQHRLSRLCPVQTPRQRRSRSKLYANRLPRPLPKRPSNRKQMQPSRARRPYLSVRPPKARCAWT